MKIAIFSDNFYPEISGISDSILLLGKELAKSGHQVHFFGAKYSQSDYAVASLPDKELDMGKHVKFHRFLSLPMLGSPTGQSRIVIPFGLRCLKYRKEKFDIIYTQSPYGMGMEALFMSRLFGVPLIGTNHTPITEFTRYIPFSNPLFDWIGLKFVSWYYNRCKFVSAPFQGILDEMKTYGFKRPCQALSNPIDVANFVSPTLESKKQLKEKYGVSGKKILIYAGRLAPEKQINVIIEALKEVLEKVPEAFLFITGIGNAEKPLLELTKKLGLENNVKFFGRVSDEQHVTTYQAADIFVIMSTAETQSLSLMKAMSVGIPVVGADAWALPNYIGRDEKRGYVVPIGDEKKLAERLIFLLENDEVRKNMGQEGIAFAKTFSAASVAKIWEGIFSEYLNT